MKNFVRITFILIAILICSASMVKAATTDELVAYMSKTFTIAGEEITASQSDIINAKRYLQEYPVSSEDADKIMAKIDEAVKVLEDAGTTDFSKLSKTQKDNLTSIAQEAASIAGATISYDSKNKVVTIYKDGKVFTAKSVTSNFVQTGSDNTVYAVSALVAIIAVAAIVGYRETKNA